MRSVARMFGRSQNAFSAHDVASSYRPAKKWANAVTPCIVNISGSRGLSRIARRRCSIATSGSPPRNAHQKPHADRRFRAPAPAAKRLRSAQSGNQLDQRIPDGLGDTMTKPKTWVDLTARGVEGMSCPRLGHDADIGLGRLPALRILLLGLVVADRTGDDHVLAVLPIYRGRHLVLGSELQRVDHAQHLVEIAAGRHRIDQNELDLLVRSDDEDVAYGLVVGGRALRRVAGHGGGKHAVELRHLEIGVCDDRVIGGETLRLLDVAGPAVMAGERVDGQSDDLDAALVELGLDLGHVAELGGAHRREVLGMREQHHPFVADPLVEADLAFGGLRFEIRRSVVDGESHDLPPSRGRHWAGKILRQPSMGCGSMSMERVEAPCVATAERVASTLTIGTGSGPGRWLPEHSPPQSNPVGTLALIPNPIDQNPWAHWRSPMDMMRQG